MQSATPGHISPNEARSARRRVAASARKRIANACLACKSRKQKCDGQQPCNICSRRGAACIYVEQPSRHAKRRRVSQVDVSSAAGDDPTTSERTSLKPPRSPSSPNQNRHSQYGHHAQTDISNDAHTNSQYAYPTPSHGNPTLQSVASHTGASEDVDTDDDTVEAPVDHRTRLLSDPSGRLLYIGETGSLSFLARVRKLVKDALGQSSFTSDSEQHSIADKPVIPRLQHTLGISASLPPLECATALVDLFFENVNSVYYVLDHEEMKQVMAVVYSGGLLHATIGDRNRDIAFVNAICAVGTFFTKQPDLSVGDGMHYFDTARTMMEDVFESADFWSVRLLLLFALYMQYAAKRNSSWTYVGLAIRVAESLGLHRISPVEYQADTNLERRRRLVFWSLYSLDRFTGCSLGRPLAIEDENCNDPVFSMALTDDFLLDSRCSSDQPDIIHQIHQLAAKVRLHVIIGHIVKIVYLKRSISRDVTESLSDELKTWWKSLPACASLNNGTNAAIVHLHMTYLHAVTLLTRPFLQRVVEASIEDSIGDASCKCKRRSVSRSNVKRKMLRYAGACVLVAERTVALAHRMRTKGNLPKNDASLIYYLFTAGLVLMFSALPQILCSREDGPTGEDDVGKFRTRSPALLAIMGEFASVETCTAKRYHSILSQFAQALLDGRERLQREEQAQKPEGQEPSVAEPAFPEPDLLDELQATSTEYFAGSFRSRAGSTEPAIRESVAAHSLVSVASNGQLDPHGQLISPHLESGGFSELGVTPVGSNLQYHSGIMDKDSEVINGMSGLMDFSSFFGWLEDGVVETQAIPWEFSWDGPPSNYFLSSRMSPGT